MNPRRISLRAITQWLVIDPSKMQPMPARQMFNRWSRQCCRAAADLIGCSHPVLDVPSVGYNDIIWPVCVGGAYRLGRTLETGCRHSTAGREWPSLSKAIAEQLQFPLSWWRDTKSPNGIVRIPLARPNVSRSRRTSFLPKPPTGTASERLAAKRMVDGMPPHSRDIFCASSPNQSATLGSEFGSVLHSRRRAPLIEPSRPVCLTSSRVSGLTSSGNVIVSSQVAAGPA